MAELTSNRRSVSAFTIERDGLHPRSAAAWTSVRPARSEDLREQSFFSTSRNVSQLRDDHLQQARYDLQMRQVAVDRFALLP